MDIKFGTDGWRGIIARDFTFANLSRVAEAVACYLEQQQAKDKPVVVGHDTRFLSEEFAATVAERFTAKGIRVLMAANPCPTPAVAAAVLDQQASGAVMLTASHNPHYYHGFKFIPWYAGPALPEVTDEITRLLPDEPGDVSPQPGLVADFDPRPGYMARLEQIIDLERIASSGIRLAVNPMHGAGAGYIEQALDKQGIPYTAQCANRDPFFGGKMPEPKPQLLQDLSELVSQGGFDLGLALDGDGDRFGIIDKEVGYILPNQFLCLLAEYLINEKEIKGPLARTVSTTTMLDRIARAHGLEVIETPVGFKYQAQALMEKGAILAGEESGGLSIKGHIPEKDGILACLLAAEMAACRPLARRLEQLTANYGAVFTNRLDLHCQPGQKEDILSKLDTWRPRQLAGTEITDIITMDGWKYQLADDSWVLVRPSGTEPLFRIYAEAGTAERVSQLQQHVAGQLGMDNTTE